MRKGKQKEGNTKRQNERRADERIVLEKGGKERKEMREERKKEQ